jgi:MFS transporter, PAT family, beta-lactamase induction signal transducer AmpG
MRRQLPPWAMGLAGAPLGFYFGFISTATPILLRAHGVPVETIGRVSAIGFSPSFWAFLLCPILDVGFSKRTYAIFFAGVAAVCLGVSTLLTFHLVAFTAVLTLGCTATVLFGNAHQGWMPDAVEEKHFSAVGAMSTVANLGAAGLFAWVTVDLLRAMSPHPAGFLLALGVFAPTGMLFFIPPSKTPLRTAREVFGTFFRDLYQVCKRRSSVLGLICFLSPTACFALTNSFSDLGTDFRASEDWVTRINGPLVAIVCSAGALVGIWFCQRFLRRTVYVVAGFGGAAAAVAMIWLPHTLVFFAAGVLTYNFFQGINYTAFSAFEYEIVGPGNVLAATQISLLTAAANAPISYMTLAETHVYTKHGLPGMLGVDAVGSVATGIILLLVFRKIAVRRAPTRPSKETLQPS